MKSFYHFPRLSHLSAVLSFLTLFMAFSISAYGSNITAFIITTVDNIKGQYTMDVFKTVCTSDAYVDYEYIRINGSDEVYDKDCICEKYAQYYNDEGDKYLYKKTFWRVVRECETPDVLNIFENDLHGGVKGHENTPETERDLVVKRSIELSTVTDFTAELSVYPNPAQDFFMLDYQLKEGDFVQMSFYDALGKEVKFNNGQLSQEIGNQSTTYDISDLSGGVYFYVISINNEKISGRLIISD